MSPSGPPTIRPHVVADHAAQFDEELGERSAGSQEEQAASQYVLGHLQQAGYFVQLDAVPVANLVESTNLVALPPNGEEAATIVCVAYDSSGERAGESVGVFLELARALYATEPDHYVEFVALGAERSAEHLGSRRLAQLLTESERNPGVITIVPGSSTDAGARGALAKDIEEAADVAGIDLGPPPPLASAGGVDVFAEAGFDSALVWGSPADLSAVLLAYLAPPDE